MTIENKNFCILPWTHIYFFTDGYAYPCPKMTTFKNMRLGKNSDKIEDLWNSDVLKDLRKNMLSPDGKVPICDSQCNCSINSCKRYVGDELHKNSLSLINSTNINGELNSVNYIAWNIPETTLCNFSCLYCNSNYSSRWYSVDHPQEIGGVKSTFETLDDLKSKIDPYMNTVEEIHFASGESVFQDSYYYILDELIRLGRNNDPNLRLFFITNLSSMSYKGRNIYELLNKFQNVKLLASLDAMGDRAEIIRFGCKWNSIEDTRQKLKEYKNIKFYLQPVMSSMNILHFPDFHLEWMKRGWCDYDSVRYYVLTSPKEFNIRFLSDDLKFKINSKYSDYINTLKSHYSSSIDLWPNREQPHVFLEKMLSEMNSKPYNKDINEDFLKKIKGMETKFNFNFFKTFPELNGMIH